MKTALYMRVSTTEQATEGYSLASQKRKLVAFCDAMGWEIVDIYSDEGISGSTIEKRPAATQMLEDVKTKRFENILIMKVDRLCRNTKDLLNIVDLLQKYNVRLNAVDEKIDYTTDVGKMVLTMLGSFAEFERNRISSRMKEGRVQKTLQGIKSHTGVTVYGYTYENGVYKKNIDEANVVSYIFNSYTNGEPLKAIARNLLNSNAPLGNLKIWNPDNVRRILSNPTYKGCCYNGYYIKGNAVPSKDYVMQKAKNVDQIVSDELWEQASNIRESRRYTNTRKYAKDDFVFADVAYCGLCGKKLYSKVIKDKNYPGTYRLYYRCQDKQVYKKCTFYTLSNAKFEKFLLEFFEEQSIKLVNPPTTNNDEIDLEKQYLSRLGSLERKKAKLTNKYLEDLIDDETYQKFVKEIDSEIRKINEQIDANKKSTQDVIPSANLENIQILLRDIWPEMSNKEKRVFVTSTFEKIFVGKNKIEKIVFR